MMDKMISFLWGDKTYTGGARTQKKNGKKPKSPKKSSPKKKSSPFLSKGERGCVLRPAGSALSMAKSSKKSPKMKKRTDCAEDKRNSAVSSSCMKNTNPNSRKTCVLKRSPKKSPKKKASPKSAKSSPAKSPANSPLSGGRKSPFRFRYF